MEERPSLFMANSSNKLYKDIYNTNQRASNIKEFPIIGNIRRDEYFIVVNLICFDFYYPRFYGVYYFDSKKEKLIYGLIEKDSDGKGKFYQFIVPLNIRVLYTLSRWRLIIENFCKI